MTRSFFSCGFTAILTLSLTQAGFGQCEVYDFEGFAPGTIATDLIPGVTFTCEPGSCGGGPLPEIAVVDWGSGGATNAVRPHEGCPGASPDTLVLTFDENQGFIQFGLGSDISGLEIRVRWYNEFGTPLGTRFYDSGSGVDVIVTIEGAPIIRSVELWQVNSNFEYVDNLRFGEDVTLPTVEIDTPVFNECVCGDSVVSIIGTVEDLDGSYECDVAEYRPVDADADEPWTQFSQACGAFSGVLHSWNTVGIAEGRYYIRLTGANTCGLLQSDITVVRVDRSFDALSLQPVKEPVCGVATIKGGISDRCGVSWILDQQPVSGGVWVEIASGTSGVSCELADWDTTTVEDDVYVLRLRGTDGCGHTAEVTQEIIVDNESGCACTPDINGDGVVDVLDLLLLLAAWTP